MNEPPPPIARPVDTAVIPVQVVPLARPLVHADRVPYPLVKPRTEPFAVASAVCGLAGIIPVLSQLIGLSLGIASLVRLRRAERAGVRLAGRGWAITGIVSSGFALIGWIGFALALASLGSSMLDAAGTLGSVLQEPV